MSKNNRITPLLQTAMALVRFALTKGNPGGFTDRCRCYWTTVPEKSRLIELNYRRAPLQGAALPTELSREKDYNSNLIIIGLKTNNEPCGLRSHDPRLKRPLLY